MNSLLDQTITINFFSIIDIVALLITTPVLIVSVIRFARVTRDEADLAFTLVTLAVVLAGVLILAEDNIVPAGVPSVSIQDGASYSLSLVRGIYVLGAQILAATLHFALRYTNSQHLKGAKVMWLYAGAISLCPLIWSPLFLKMPSHPNSITSSWKRAVPWHPVSGELLWIYAALWIMGVCYVQYLLWRGASSGSLRSAATVRSTTVIIGLAVISFSAVVMIIEALSGYLGVALAPFAMSVGMGVVGVGLVFEWELSTREHEHVTQRFQSYVDPALVKYVLEHPENVRFEGEVRELTVVFTDLEGYTPLAEALRERAVPLLNEYFSLLTPLIREQNGYRSKFLGDGIMFFYGAPEWNCDHAIQAVATVLKMQQTLAQFNASLFDRGMKPLVTRIGVSSGEMVVGDAGSAEGSDYTVLGDAVNLGARLESANKITGTHILMGEGTMKLLPRDLFLVRPIGKLQVVGLSRAVMTYEPLSYCTQASDLQRNLARLTQHMVDAFIGGDFEACLNAEHHLVEACGPSKLAALYRRSCEEWIAQPAGAEFSGEIVLTAK